MRLVRVTIEYDMDDLTKPLHNELKDWLDGNVSVADIITPNHRTGEYQWATPTTLVNYYSTLETVRINELDSQGEVK